MTLRARLLLTVGVLLAVALVAAGLLIAGLTRASLVQQLDDQLRRTAAGGRIDRILDQGPGDQLLGRQFAFLIVGPRGEVLLSAPSGPARDPDPLPVVPEQITGGSGLASGTIIEAESEDGSVDYRLHVGPGPRGSILLIAAPLGEMQGATAALVRNLLLVGVLVLLAALAIGWALIRHDLRPLEGIAATATRIAGGDLSHRATVTDERTEVGRVGAAFNTMLDAIEVAFDEQRAALEARERS
ncbi:MAG TPA: HAMP domain-containing protein, partial [Candidatus Limnocylindrales bacterium]|nr:HAMP domain-containing protein [Candidatus Limnocylindrales bacterium]